MSGNYSDFVKHIMLQYVYSAVDLSKYKYKILKSKDELYHIDSNYYISNNYVGNNCLMVFMKNKDRFYSFLIDRKTLKYDKDMLRLGEVSITNFSLRVDEKMYDGTIFDGIHANDTFIICDVYLLFGNPLNDNLMEKMDKITQMMDKMVTHDTSLNTLRLEVNDLHELSEIHEIAERFTGNTCKIRNNGITFYPKQIGTKLLFISKNKHHNAQSAPQKNRQRLDIKYVSQSGLHIKNAKQQCDVVTFEMRKTEYCDVYTLHLVYTTRNEELLSKYVDIACIPTIECSKYVSEHVNDAHPRALFKCKYDKIRDKWVPIEVDDKSEYPDDISVIN